MGESPSPELRIGDTEREAALRALGEHMSVGRLEVDEYGERAARVTAAKTRGELLQLFADLPEPHPRIGGPAPVAMLDEPDRVPASRNESRLPTQRIAGALVPLSGILALVLFVAIPGMEWWIFLLPCAIGIISGALWGEEHRKKEKHKPQDH